MHLKFRWIHNSRVTSCSWFSELRVTFYELKLDIYEFMRQILGVEYLSYELRVTSYEFKISVLICELWVNLCELQLILRVKSCFLQVEYFCTSYEQILRVEIYFTRNEIKSLIQQVTIYFTTTNKSFEPESKQFL